MALSPSINFVIRDAKGATSTMTVHVPTTTAPADVLEAAESLAPLIVAVISGEIVQIQACIGVTLPAQTGAAAGSDVEEGAKMLLDVDGGRGSRLRVPTFLESLVIPGSVDVDQSDASVQALRDALLSGVTAPTSGNTVAFGDYRDGDFAGLLSFEEDFTRSRKRR